MTDRGDAAIAAAEAPDAVPAGQFQMRQFQAVIASSGRPVVLLVPADVTDTELLEVTGWIGNGVRVEIDRARQPLGGRLIMPALRTA